MKLDITLPTEYRVGSIHSAGILSLGKNVVFEVVGWYINHYTEPGIMRYIKDGNAIAIREVDPATLHAKAEELKRESRSIRTTDPKRYKPIFKLGGKPIRSTSNKPNASVISRLIGIGLITPDEASEIFAGDPVKRTSKVIDLLGGHDPSKTDVFD